jgi:hypothetical protein
MPAKKQPKPARIIHRSCDGAEASGSVPSTKKRKAKKAPPLRYVESRMVLELLDHMRSLANKHRLPFLAGRQRVHRARIAKFLRQMDAMEIRESSAPIIAEAFARILEDYALAIDGLVMNVAEAKAVKAAEMDAKPKARFLLN